MLAFAFGSHHIEGGIYYMAPLSTLFVVSIAIFIYVIVKGDYTSQWIEVSRHMGFALLAYGVFGTLVGFFHMFDALESIKEELPRQMIAGGVKVALLNALYGVAYFWIIQGVYLLLRILGAKRSGA